MLSCEHMYQQDGPMSQSVAARPDNQLAKCFVSLLLSSRKIPLQMQTSSGTSSSHDQDENHQGPGSHLASLAVAAEPFLEDAAVAQLLDADGIEKAIIHLTRTDEEAQDLLQRIEL